MASQHGDRAEVGFDWILHQHPRLDQDIFQLDTQLWAIHGYIPVDGEVILAEFDRRETARAVLAQLAAALEVTEMRSTIASTSSTSWEEAPDREEPHDQQPVDTRDMPNARFNL